MITKLYFNGKNDDGKEVQLVVELNDGKAILQIGFYTIEVFYDDISEINNMINYLREG